MNDIAIYSISTENYLPKGAAALKSLSDSLHTSVDTYNFSLNDIIAIPDYNIQKIINRYKNYNPDYLRWTLKPAIILYLLNNQKYKKCIYIDNDIFFVNDSSFLIDNLNGVLLTPHFRPHLPSTNKTIQAQFLALLTDGFFNAGFIAVEKTGIPAIDWWYNVLYWRCEKNKCAGIYDDQKYLDIMCLQFSNIVEICKHPGCNIAEWNQYTNTAELIGNKWVINSQYDPIFFHFSGAFRNESWKNEHPMMFEYYQKFLQSIKE